MTGAAPRTDGQPVAVALEPERLELLRRAVGSGCARRVRRVAEPGGNPARIIPAWLDFVAAHSARGGPAQAVGEPVWPGRRPEEVLECQLHESLLNLVRRRSTRHAHVPALTA